MPYSNLNTAAFDGKGRIWFTGQNGSSPNGRYWRWATVGGIRIHGES